jgi:hypothetical protein
MNALATAQDPELLAATLPSIDYSMALGWNAQYGGLLYFVDPDEMLQASDGRARSRSGPRWPRKY